MKCILCNSVIRENNHNGSSHCINCDIDIIYYSKSKDNTGVNVYSQAYDESMADAIEVNIKSTTINIEIHELDTLKDLINIVKSIDIDYVKKHHVIGGKNGKMPIL